MSGSQRLGALADVPTTVEAGFPNSEYNFWVGLFAPSKTPAPILARLHRDSLEALQNPAVRERLGKLGADPMILSAADFDKLVREEVALNTKIAAAVGVKAMRPARRSMRLNIFGSSGNPPERRAIDAAARRPWSSGIAVGKCTQLPTKAGMIGAS